MKNRHGITLMVLGLCLLVAAAALTMANRQEEQRGARASERAEKILKQEVIPSPSDAEGRSSAAAARQMQTVEIDGHEYIGVLEIPSLELSLPVLRDWNEELLKLAPCRYSGSFPDDSMIIAGHNYQKHFNGIKRLKKGDDIRFTDVNGAVYEYTVEELAEIPGTDVEGMERGEWDLTLFTCTYGGQNRVAVRCTRRPDSAS